MSAHSSLIPSSHRHEIVSRMALFAGFCGAMSTVPMSPALRGILLLVFTLVGPGSAILCWIELDTAATVAAVVGLSVATILAFAVAMAWLSFWAPVPSCLLLSAFVAASGAARMRALHIGRREGVLQW